MNVWRRHMSLCPLARPLSRAQRADRKAWRIRGACVGLAIAAPWCGRRPYLVSAVPGARQRAVARARRPVREVPRQLVQDGRGIVLGARGHRRRHGDWLRARARVPRLPARRSPAAAATSCRAGDRARAPGSQGAQVRSGSA